LLISLKRLKPMYWPYQNSNLTNCLSRWNRTTFRLLIATLKWPLKCRLYSLRESIIRVILRLWKCTIIKTLGIWLRTRLTLTDGYRRISPKSHSVKLDKWTLALKAFPQYNRNCLNIITINDISSLLLLLTWTLPQISKRLSILRHSSRLLIHIIRSKPLY